MIDSFPVHPPSSQLLISNGRAFLAIVDAQSPQIAHTLQLDC